MTKRFTTAIIAMALFPSLAVAQGPLLSHLTDAATELPWASCYVYLEGGSKHRIPFLPVISRLRAPLGSGNYTRDIGVDAALVFVGNGIVRKDRSDAYRDLDVSGKAVMLAYDFAVDGQMDLEREVTLEDRVREAVSRKAAAVVLFSTQVETPFPMFREQQAGNVPDVPVIVLGRRSAETVLAAAGMDLEALLDDWKAKSVVSPQALIARLGLRINTAFARLDGPHFTLTFEKSIDGARIKELADGNEKAVAFILDVFREARVTWRKSPVTYFRNFDSKVFYTHHWGKGLSSDAGVFSVFNPSESNFGLAVHENTHTLLGDNWGNTTSFLNEGLARYAEALATQRDRDHRETAAFIRASRLFPLAEMVQIDIGRDPRTEVAYPAAGSFVGYLIATHGLERVARLYRLEGRDAAARGDADSWTGALRKGLPELEADWLRWLRQLFLDPPHGQAGHGGRAVKLTL